MNILDRLFELQDRDYAEFQSRLTPSISPDSFIGVRVPLARKLAKSIVKEESYGEFFNELPHRYYDENMLHGLIISEIKDYKLCIYEIDRFLPYVDNWAVCDIMSPKIFKKHKAELISKIKEWISSDKPFICRFGIGMLMAHYLDDEFDRQYLEMIADLRSDEYYVNMMIAWFFATALAKQWDTAISYIENERMSKWTHNKTIQKSRESYRITKKQKEYLKGLKK